MNYELKEVSFPSKDGIHTIYGEIYIPKEKEPRGIVQLAHGMIDHVGRYEDLANYLTGEGYIFAGHNHLGHGKSVSKNEDFGFFAEKNGVELVLGDMFLMNRILREKYPTLPLVVMGHSMGSFITRLYAVKYPHSMNAVIIHGTGGPNPRLGMGKALASLIKGIRGPRHRSALIHKLAFGSYNSKFPKSEGKHAWLTRDIQRVADRDEDKFTNFKFTVSGFIDLFTMLGESNSESWYKNYPKDIPTLIISGDMDPVGDYGKGPDRIYKEMLVSGCEKVSLKMYKGARHELFNETNREEVFLDLVKWIASVI